MTKPSRYPSVYAWLAFRITHTICRGKSWELCRRTKERTNTIGKAMNSAPTMEENDVTHEKMMEFEPLLEPAGERNLRSINLTHGEFPCHCLAQTVWYPEHSTLCLIWDVEEIRSVGLPDHQQKPPSRGQLDAGVAMDRGKCDKISRIEGTNSGINTCH